MSILFSAMGDDQELVRKAVLEMTDQTELFKIASDNKYGPLVRRTAVFMLTDIDALTRLAANDKNWRVSVSAYRQLHRMDAIPKVPAGENSFALWLPDHADDLPRLADVPLSDAALMEASFTENLAKAALFCISSSRDMSFIARHDQRPAVRRVALKKAQEEESFYLKFALHDPHSGVRLAAAEQLTGDEAVDAVLREGSGSAQAVAAKKTSNMQLLKKTALTSDRSSIHRIALTRTEDWTLLEIIAMLGRTQGIEKGMARWRMECMQTQWLESGLALLSENQQLYADAARNDRKFYNLVIDHITDEDCLAEILCSLSPHHSGATSYGPIGEAGYIIKGAGFPSSNPEVVARTLGALDRIRSPQALKKVAECARTDFLRKEAVKRIDASNGQQPLSTSTVCEQTFTGKTWDGKYDLIKLLEFDPPFRIYDAKERKSGRCVRLLTPDSEVEDDDKVKRLLYDIYVQSTSVHDRENEEKHTLGWFDPGFCDDRIRYLVSDQPFGVSLLCWMKTHAQLSIETALVLTIQLLQALSRIHGPCDRYMGDGDYITGDHPGFVHRCVSPGNIRIVEGEKLKLLLDGFGSAVPYGERNKESSQFYGVVAFSSRHQLADAENPCASWDVWAAAACLYYMLTGIFPRDLSGNMWENLLKKKPTPIRERRADVPAKLADVIDYALDDSVEDLHYSTAKQLLDALAEVI